MLLGENGPPVRAAPMRPRTEPQRQPRFVGRFYAIKTGHQRGDRLWLPRLREIATHGAGHTAQRHPARFLSKHLQRHTIYTPPQRQGHAGIHVEGRP
jgi:hypothetical protein